MLQILRKTVSCFIMKPSMFVREIAWNRWHLPAVIRQFSEGTHVCTVVAFTYEGLPFTRGLIAEEIQISMDWATLPCPSSHEFSEIFPSNLKAYTSHSCNEFMMLAGLCERLLASNSFCMLVPDANCNSCEIMPFQSRLKKVIASRHPLIEIQTFESWLQQFSGKTKLNFDLIPVPSHIQAPKNLPQKVRQYCFTRSAV